MFYSPILERGHWIRIAELGSVKPKLRAHTAALLRGQALVKEVHMSIRVSQGFVDSEHSAFSIDI